MPPSSRLPILSAAVLVSAVGAPAQTPEPKPPAQAMNKPAADCTAPAILPDALASWSAPVPLPAAKEIKGLAAATLTPGRAVTLALMPTPQVAYPLRPEKPGGSVSFGGLARFTVDQPGTWRVALGSGAWIDVIGDGKAALSTAHGHGPDCSGIRKMVDYSLTPGTYMLQVAANGSDSLPVLVTRLP